MQTRLWVSDSNVVIVIFGNRERERCIECRPGQGLYFLERYLHKHIAIRPYSLPAFLLTFPILGLPLPYTWLRSDHLTTIQQTIRQKLIRSQAMCLSCHTVFASDLCGRLQKAGLYQSLAGCTVSTQCIRSTVASTTDVWQTACLRGTRQKLMAQASKPL